MIHICKPYRLNGYPDAVNGLRDLPTLLPGDTIEIHGIHDAGYTDRQLIIDAAEITVYFMPGSQLLPCASRLEGPDGWVGPDSNGVYHRPYKGNTLNQCFEDGRRLQKGFGQTNWQPGTFNQVGNILYIKPYDGTLEHVWHTNAKVGIQVLSPNVTLHSPHIKGSRYGIIVNAPHCTIHNPICENHGNMGISWQRAHYLKIFNAQISHCKNGLYGNTPKITDHSDSVLIDNALVTDNDPEQYYEPVDATTNQGDNHPFAVQGGSNGVYDVTVQRTGWGVGLYQFLNQPFIGNEFTLDISNVGIIHPTIQREARALSFSGDRDIEGHLHHSNSAMVRIDQSQIGIYMKARDTKGLPPWDLDATIFRCDTGLLVPLGAAALNANLTTSQVRRPYELVGDGGSDKVNITFQGSA